MYAKEVEDDKVEFQLEKKRRERLVQDGREATRKALVEEVKRRANESLPLVVVSASPHPPSTHHWCRWHNMFIPVFNLYPHVVSYPLNTGPGGS